MQVLEETIQRYPVLTCCRESMQQAAEIQRAAFAGGRKMLLCGNGVSAADAEHWSGELLKQFVMPRPVPEAFRKQIGSELAENLQRGFPVIPLPSFVSLGTAYANDCSPNHIFAQLAYALGRPGDVLVGISTSGNSENICHALRVARALEMKTIGLTGESGGAMRELCDVCIRVPERETYKVQELHLPVYHTLSIMIEEMFCK